MTKDTEHIMKVGKKTYDLTQLTSSDPGLPSSVRFNLYMREGKTKVCPQCQQDLPINHKHWKPR